MSDQSYEDPSIATDQLNEKSKVQFTLSEFKNEIERQ
jgi:hypothetical protein